MKLIATQESVFYGVEVAAIIHSMMEKVNKSIRGGRSGVVRYVLIGDDDKVISQTTSG